MNDRQQIGRNNACLKDALRGVLPLVESGNYEEAMQHLRAAGNYAWLQSCGQLACIEIEDLIVKLSEVLPALQRSEPQTPEPFVATVLTSIHAAGGHSRLAWRWVQLDRDRRHHVILTSQGSAPIPVQLLELVDTGRVMLTLLDAEPTLWGRAMQLRQLVTDAEAVILHIHPDDPIAPVALAKMSAARPVLFVDHASHVFWMGACAANVVITLHAEACRTTATRRGVPATQICWWPFSSDLLRLDGLPRLPVREKFNIPADAVTLLTSGWPYKFRAIEGLSFSMAIAPVLASRPNTHLIAVGPAADDSEWKDLLTRFPGRIHLQGVQDEQFMTSCYHACDVYLDSIPFSSGSAVMEAAALGKPILKFATQEMRDSGFAADLDTVPLPAYNWTDLAAYRNSLLDLIDMTPYERAKLGSIISSSIRNWHNDDVCRFFLEKAYRQAKNSAKIQIAADLAEEKFTPLDRLLIALGENYRLCQGDKLAPPPARLLAFYLPQFHEIPENNAWWGQGFTEWTNVRQGKPLFEGHQQPLTPTELGYYDLSSSAVLEQQAKLAKEHGIFGFCFYHYWFDGKRLLEKPVDQLLAAPHIDLPFCLCWANENWTRRWDGGEQDVLMHQSYSPALHERFAQDLAVYFADARYIRIGGRPVVLIYRTDIIPDLASTTAAWRTAWRDLGVGEVYLVAVESFVPIDPAEHGFDAAAEFPPHQVHAASLAPDMQPRLLTDPDARVGDYRKLAQTWLQRPRPHYKRFRGLLPGWDNSARRRQGGATLFVNASPDAYEDWLTQTVGRTLNELQGEERLVFVNAWNEWGEGCTLEPDARWGRGYLEATRRVLQRPEGELRALARRNAPPPDYDHWLAQDSLTPGGALVPALCATAAKVVLAVAVSGADVSGMDATRASLAAQLRPANAIAIGTGARLAELAPMLQGSDWTLCLCAGDTLTPDALAHLARAFAVAPAKALVAYADHDERDEEGHLGSPFLKPAFNHELLLSCPYMGRALAVRSDWLQTHLVNTEATSFDLPFAYGLMLAAMRKAGASGFMRIPVLALHLTTKEPTVFASTSAAWQAQAALLTDHAAQAEPGSQLIEGPLPGSFHLVPPLQRTPRVSIIIPTRDQLPFLSRCIESLLAKTDYPAFEIIVVDNDSQTHEAGNYLDGLRALNSDQIRVISVPGAFNFSRMNNLAAQQARGEFLLLLNNDTAALHADWLGHLMRQALRQGVGAVGARLLFPDGSVQHAGVVLGLRGPADHPLLGLPGDRPGYLARAQLTQDFSAVTAACLLVSKAVYEEVGGLDEDTFGVSYNDVDFCLRVGETGRRIVWTPLATLLHEGSASQKARVETSSNDQKAKRFAKEQASMYQRWPKQIANDPTYNPNLSLVENGYEIETNPLLRFDKLQGLVPHRVVAFAADETGCGHYRVFQPMQAMSDAGLCTGGASPEMMGPNLVLRSGADTLIFQRPYLDSQLDLLGSLLPLKGIKKIYELDDNINRVPLKSAHHGQFGNDIHRRVNKAIGLCDRLVVSTLPLAHELRGKNDDIRVVLNRLPTRMWGETPTLKQSLPEKSKGARPKVGWAGGIGHAGDLEMIGDVIRALSDQIDWVFFGMCPESLKPFVREFHAGVSTLDYPAKLVALSQTWDLAIAPLEINAFNECKSNLKLLEYGWCGVPVVCTDITPYQGDLPCKRVKNRFADWRNTILSMTSDPHACRQEGLRLQQTVQASWMLKAENLQSWYEAWTD